MRPFVLSVREYPFYSIAFAIALAIWLIPERISALWLRSARDPTARQEDRGSYVLLVGLVGAGLAAGFILAVRWTGAAIPWFRPQVTIAGIVLILLGVVLRRWAIITLGRYFTFDVAVRPTQTVVQSGPYRLVRHPAYSGLLLSIFGVGVALANWASLAAAVGASLIGLIYRVRVEERALTEGLGQPYVNYLRRTKRFIPFVY